MERHHFTATGHALERHHHVLDFAVFSRALTGAASRDPAPHRAAYDRRRKVAERVPAPLELLFEWKAHGACLHRQGGAGRVEVHDAGHALHVEHHHVRLGQHAAAHSAAGAERHERRAGAPAKLHDANDVGGRFRPHDGARTVRAHRARAHREVMPRPEVARVRDLVHELVRAAYPGNLARKPRQERRHLSANVELFALPGGRKCVRGRSIALRARPFEPRSRAR